MADEPAPITRGERAAGIFGALFFLVLAVLAIDLATGGKVFKRAGCGCPDEGTASDGGS